MQTRSFALIFLSALLSFAQYPPPPQQYPPAQQAYPQQPPAIPPQQLDQLVAGIALYEDGLLAEVLTAATYSNEIPDAANWANEHSYMRGDQLSAAIQQDQLPWDRSVIALLPFPQVLSYMAQNMAWTQDLGNAVLAQRPDVMDAVQRQRQLAYDYGYLRTSQYQTVTVAGPGQIEILPPSPGYYYVPYYDPRVVYVRPRPGYFVGSAIRWGPGITIGAAFAPWGWGNVGFGWREREIFIDRHPWERTWVNRRTYVHPYAVPRTRYSGPPVEHHGRDHRDHH
jgi:hypothetical protein